LPHQETLLPQAGWMRRVTRHNHSSDPLLHSGLQNNMYFLMYDESNFLDYCPDPDDIEGAEQEHDPSSKRQA
jgi:hypothetical protein